MWKMLSYSVLETAKVCFIFLMVTNSIFRWNGCAPMAKRRGGVGVATWHGFLYAIGGHDAPASSLASRLSDCVERWVCVYCVFVWCNRCLIFIAVWNVKCIMFSLLCDVKICTGFFFCHPFYVICFSFDMLSRPQQETHIGSKQHRVNTIPQD